MLWLGIDHIAAVVEHLCRYAAETEGISLEALASEPYETLEEHPGICIVHSDEPNDGCAVHGHYSPSPPTIHVVRSSTEGREHFTLLHEYAHHLQQHDPEWADVEWRIEPPELRRRVNEAVANEFASLTLIPASALVVVSPLPTARQVAELHQSARASRQAAIVRIAKVAESAAATGTMEHCFITLATVEGTVVFSSVLGDDVFPPPLGSYQPDLAALADAAVEAGGRARRVASHGIVYSSGTTRSDLILDGHLAHDGGYVFVVGTREHRYGRAKWDNVVHVCSSPACETEFTQQQVEEHCGTCHAARCPHCRACGCLPATLQTCQRCWTELSKAESDAGRTEHSECP